MIFRIVQNAKGRANTMGNGIVVVNFKGQFMAKRVELHWGRSGSRMPIERGPKLFVLLVSMAPHFNNRSK
jgi:hypothetical protein